MVLTATEVWRRDLHEQPNARTTVGSMLVIVPERRTYLVRVDPGSGSPIWEAKTQNTWGWLAHDARRAYWLNQFSLVQCHDLMTGEVHWTAEQSGMWGWLVPAGDVLVLGGWRGYTPVVALDVMTGEQRWKLELDGERGGEPMVGPWGVAVPLLDESRLLFLDAQGSTTGDALLPPREQDPDASPLLRRSGERLYLAGRDGLYHVLEKPWRTWHTLFEHPPGIATMTPVVLDDLVVFMDRSGQLCCYDLAAGDPRWAISWQHDRRDLLPAALSTSGLLAVGNANGRLAVLGPAGDVIWSMVVAKRIETEMAWIDERTVLAGTTGALVALRPPLP